MKEIFKTLDKDDDGYISKIDFKLAFKKANISLEEKILDEAYCIFDLNNDDKISFKEFLTVIFG